MPAQPESQQPDNSQDGRLSPQTWNALVKEMAKHNPSVIGTTGSAQSARVGKYLEIVPNSPVFRHFLEQPRYQELIRNATQTVLGVKLEPRVVDSISESPAKKEKTQIEDPLASFLSKAKALGVPLDIKE